MMEAVTIIIPTYNRAALLPKAIDSVLSQSYDNFELIVVDDGSDDNTAEILSDYSNIIYLFQENRGPAAARNRGIRAARHDLIAFLDSDDWFAADKLEIQTRAMKENPGFLISHTDEIWYRQGKLLNQKKKHRKYGGDIFARCLPLCAVSMSTVMVRKEMFARIGMFGESYPCCEDYEFWLRASIRHKFLKIDQPLTLKDGGRPDEVSFQYRTGMDKFRIQALLKLLNESELTRNQKKLAQEELVRKCRIYGNGCLKHGRPEEGVYFLDLAQTIS
jgi:glycosyltransferase involved in cell wall biosynthesis